MKFSIKMMVLVIFLSILTGCGRSVKVTYLSDPEGATLYEGNRRIGYTPETMEYKLTEQDVERGFIVVRGKQARWPSGATIELDEQTISLAKGSHHEYIFLRPTNVPGQEIDARFAAEMIKANLMKEQIAIQERQLEEQRTENEIRYSQEQERIRLQREQLEQKRLTDILNKK